MVLPNTVVTILEEAFSGCKQLKSIDLSDSLKALLDKAFYECKNLERIDLPDSIEHIGHACFFGSGLKSICFPNTIKEIGAICTNCENLKNVVIPDNVEKVDGRAFDIFSNKKASSVQCAFEGMNTTIFNWRLKNIKTIYCLPGSTIQKYSREHNIPIKPLSEFKLEE